MRGPGFSFCQLFMGLFGVNGFAAQDKERECFYCLSEWVFLGSLDHDGEEVFDAFRCRRCSGTGRIRF
jgi:hypothetical protein